MSPLRLARPAPHLLRRPFAGLLLLALGLLAACAGPSGPREKLRLRSRDVFDALQNGDFQVVSQYLKPDLRTEFLARAYGVEKNLKITEFVPIGTDLAPDEKSARMTTRLSWYEVPSVKVETENVLVDLRLVDGVWLIEQVIGGPLPVPDPAATVASPPSGPSPTPTSEGAAPVAAPR